jgi:DNA-binding NtrC family response regulator
MNQLSIARVLVVDDEEIARKNLDYILRKEGYTVVMAANGAEALKKMETSNFDVVVTDIMMENISGIDVLEKTKSKYPETEVVMVTAYPSRDSAMETLKKGTFRYIAKPFKIDEIRITVKQAVAKKLLTIPCSFETAREIVRQEDRA